jgi:membrane-associated phospholipid phosphatase
LNTRRLLAPGAAALAFAVLAVLVGLGELDGLDQWSVDRLMPGLGPHHVSGSAVDSLFPIFDPAAERGHVAVSAATYAVVWVASVVPSLVLVAVALVCLRRRGRAALGVRLGLAFVAVNAVELIGKAAVVRGDLFTGAHGARVQVRPFDSSFPSGHMSRGVVLAACLALCAPRARPLALAWTAAVAAMLVAGGWHTPTDVAGGLALATAAVLVAVRSDGSSVRGRASRRVRRPGRFRPTA